MGAPHLLHRPVSMMPLTFGFSPELAPRASWPNQSPQCGHRINLAFRVCTHRIPRYGTRMTYPIAVKSSSSESHKLSSFKRTTAFESPSLPMSSGYHSKPYSIPCDPFLSDDRNDLSIPQLTLLSSFANASASSASRLSWLIKIKGVYGCLVIPTDLSSFSASVFLVACSDIINVILFQNELSSCLKY